MTSKFIYHISDIHIREHYYEDIIYAFEQLTKAMPSRSMLVIAGDIFERKIKLDQYDIQCFHQILSILTEKSIETIIIPGNHDYNTNKGGLDLITPLLRMSQDMFSNVYCYPETGVYVHHGIEFHVMSPIDGKIPEADTTHDIVMPRVAIAHEGVNGGEYYGNIKVVKPRFNISDLKNYDLVLLGDIHKPQFLTKQIAYSGSLIQNRRSEGLDHGYIKWDVRAKTGKFNKLPLKRAFINIIAKKDRDPILPDVPAREIRLEYQDCSEEFIETLVVKLEQKYGKQLTSIICNDVHFSEESPTTSTISGVEIDKESLNLETVENQLTLLEAHLKGIGEDEDTIEKIKELHIELTRDYQYEKHNWSLNYLYWDTAFCYGPGNFIDFRKFSGVIPIIGKNRTGKSAILDILMFILCKKIEKGSFLSSMANYYAKKFRVVCSFNVNEDEYVIDYQKGGRNATAVLTKNGENISQHNCAKTQEYVKDLIGPWQDFMGITVCFQNTKLFAASGSATKINDFHRYLGINGLEKIVKEVKKETRSLPKELKPLNEMVLQIGKTSKMLIEHIAEEKGKIMDISRDLQSLEREMKLFRTQKDDLLIEMPNVEGDFKKRYSEIKKKLGKHKSLKMEREVMLQEISDLGKQISDYRLEKDQMSDMIAALTDSLTPCPDISNQVVEDVPNVSLEKLDEMISSLEVNICPARKRKTDYSEDVLKYKISEKPEGNKDELLRQVQECKIKALVEIPKEDRKYIKDITNCEKYQTKLTGFRKELTYIDENKLGNLESDLKNIKTKYRSITFNSDCDKCSNNKTVLMSVSGQEVIQSEIDRMREQLTRNKELTEKIEKFEKRIRKLQEVQKILEQNKIFETNAELNAKISAIQEHENCVHDLKQIRSDKSRELLTKYKASRDYIKYKAIHEKNDSINKEIQQYKQDRDKISEKLKTATVDLRIRELIKERDEIKQFSEQKKKLQNLDDKISQLEIHIKEMVEARAESNALIIKWENQLEQRKVLDVKIKDKEEELRIKTLYVEQCLNYRNGIPFQILKHSVDDIRNNMNEILKKVTNFQIKFEFIEEVTASGKRTIQMQLYIIEHPSNTSKLLEPRLTPGGLGSGFQKFMIEIAFRLSILKVIPRFPRFLIVDEGFGCFDKENLDMVKTVLPNLMADESNDLKFILIISHLEDLQNIGDKAVRIKIRKFPNDRNLSGSYVRVGRIPDNFPTDRFAGMKPPVGAPKSLVKPQFTAPVNQNITIDHYSQELQEFQQNNLEKVEEVIKGKLVKKVKCGVCNTSVRDTEKILARHLSSKGHKGKLVKAAKKDGVIPK